MDGMEAARQIKFLAGERLVRRSALVDVETHRKLKEIPHLVAMAARSPSTSIPVGPTEATLPITPK